MLNILSYKVGMIETNCYLVYDGETKEAVIIDAGYYDEKISADIKQNNLKLKYLLLTHGHFDHMMGVKQLREEFGAAVYIHAADADYLTDVKKGRRDRIRGAEKFSLDADAILNDGDIIYLDGFNVMVLSTPGHTKGSCCFIIGNHLFTGDTLFMDDIGRTDLEDGSDKEMEQSLAKIKLLNGDYNVYPGHDETSTLEREKKYNPYLVD